MILIGGTIMFILGLVLFYSIDLGQTDDYFLRSIKNTGTFVGLAGMGVIVAGVLLVLMSREEQSIRDHSVS